MIQRVKTIDPTQTIVYDDEDDNWVDDDAKHIDSDKDDFLPGWEQS